MEARNASNGHGDGSHETGEASDPCDQANCKFHVVTTVRRNSSETAPLRKLPSEATEFAVYEEEGGAMLTLNAYLRSFTNPLAEEKEARDRKSKKAKLGTVLGVYLPTIQHIFGVIMFLRLFWIVGTAGVWQSAGIVLLCCVCTFLTSISMSAVATNGVVESGGSYFMVSRNLGPEFGSAVGILFYLANTVATSMYLVGGVEMLLVYLVPSLPKFGQADERGHISEADMFNNFRVYATLLLLLEFAAVAVGVRFVQLFAPVSLSCVIVSILSIYVGAFVASPERGPRVCIMGGDTLLKQQAMYSNGTYLGCDAAALAPLLCVGNDTAACRFEEVAAFPGFASGVISDNMKSRYMQRGQSTPTSYGDPNRDVVQDLGTNFFVLLAIYFPSVTGIMTGSNMSGDLADPQKSIPLGTVAAQLTTTFVYLTFVFIFGGTTRGELLLDKYGESLGTMVTAKLAWPTHWVLLVGSFTSTFGAALQCLCSAPRLLQSIAKDEVLPFLNVFSKLNRWGEPFRALLITTLIAECGILIGAIDYIAPIVDFFFLMCYGFVNLVCAMQTLMRAPNWRPRFKFYHWTLSLLGAALCIFIMFATYWYYSLVVIALCGGIYKYVEYNGAKKEWGDGIRGLALSTARYSLLRIEEGEQHSKNWRPQVLVLVKAAAAEELDSKSRQLMSLASQLKAGKGLLMAATLLEGDLGDPGSKSRARQLKELLKSCFAEDKVKGFAQAVVCSNRSEGLSILIQSLGIGALRPNTVVVGWPAQWKEEEVQSQYYDFLDAINKVTAAGMSLLIPKGEDFPLSCGKKLSGHIDIWWVMHDGGLLLLLPFLLRQHRVWRHCDIRVFSVASQTDNTAKMKEDLDRVVYQLRISARVQIVELGDSDLSAYTHQKTLQMEKRVQLLQQLRLSQKAIKSQPQLLMDSIRRESQSVNSPYTDVLTIETQPPEPRSSGRSAMPDCQYTFSANKARIAFNLDQSEEPEHEDCDGDGDGDGDVEAGQLQEEDEEEAAAAAAAASGYGGDAEADSGRVKKMHSAIRLNKKIAEHSGDAQLVIVNLPAPPRNRQALNNYIHYLDALSEGLPRVLFVRGTGKEVITIYS